MIRTLIIFDGKMSSAERITDGLASLIGNARITELEEAPVDLTPYGGFCFVFNFYGAVTASRTRSFLLAHREELKDKRIAFIGVGYSDLGYMNFISDTEKAAGLEGIEGAFISSESEIARVGYAVCRMMRRAVEPLEDDELFERIESFTDRHNTLALATSGDGYIRCTPCEYHYIERAFYLITSGGLKFRGILENGNVSAAIFDTYTSGTDRNFLQFAGKALAIPVGSDEYLRVLDLCGFSEEQLDEMPATPHLVKILPLRYEYYDPELEEEGFDRNQVLETNFLKQTREEGTRYAANIRRAEQTNEEAARELMEKMLAQSGKEEDQTPTEEEPEEEVFIEKEEGEAAEVSEDADILSEEPGNGGDADLEQEEILPELPEEADLDFAGETGNAAFRMPSFIKPYLENKPEQDAGTVRQASVKLPEIDMSVIAGLEAGGRHRFDEVPEKNESEIPRLNAVRFVEPEDEELEDLEDELGDDDSPVFESRFAGRRTSAASEKRKKTEPEEAEDPAENTREAGKKKPGKQGRKKKKKKGVFSGLVKAIGKMLLIDDAAGRDETEDEDEEQEPEDEES